MKLPNKLPASLARDAGTGSLFNITDFGYDYAIGGQPFLSAASHQHPIVRETNPVQKNQFDNQNNPGEQTLSGWWIRSQQSFHGGAGQVYGDPQALNVFTSRNEFNQVRFLKSRGVDVWTQGSVKLLNAVKTARVSTLPAIVNMCGFTYPDATDAVFAVNGTTFFAIQAGSVITPGTAPSTSIGGCTTDGAYVYIAAKDGVWSAPIPATAGGAWTWTKQYTVSTTKTVNIGYVKNRLILTVGNVVYQLQSHPGTPPVALPTATYTDPDTSWVFTGITEAGPAIYVVGNNGVRGSIIKLVLDNTGALPTLVAGSTACQLPAGEVVYSAMGYVGGYVGIGTNKGVRVASVETNGDLTYGPLLWSTDGPVRSWTARDRFLWCTCSRGNDGDSGLYRIDLSIEVDTLRFAYATDLVMPGDTTDCLSVAHIGQSDNIAFGTNTNTYVTDTANLFLQGYLQTSRIRFNTLEPKLYKFLRVRGPVLDGALAYQMLDQYDSVARSSSFPADGTPGTNDSSITAPNGPQDFVSIKFFPSRNTCPTTIGAQLYGYQLKALPGMPRQRIIQLPLWCFDAETDRNGKIQKLAGSAFNRLASLEEIDTAGDVVVFQDFLTNTSSRVMIDRVSFQQTAPPPKFAEWGGVITLTLRTV